MPQYRVTTAVKDGDETLMFDHTKQAASAQQAVTDQARWFASRGWTPRWIEAVSSRDRRDWARKSYEPPPVSIAPVPVCPVCGEMDNPFGCRCIHEETK